jgi:hypothetical protein
VAGADSRAATLPVPLICCFRPPRGKAMTAILQLSDRPTDKLQAALNHDWDDPDRNFPVDYLRACARWFAGLSEADRKVAGSAI